MQLFGCTWQSASVSVKAHHGAIKQTHATRVRLHIDAPLCGIKVKGQQGTLAAQNLELVDVLVAPVIPGIGEPLGVLVSQDGAVRLHGRAARQILVHDQHGSSTTSMRQTSDAMSSSPVNCRHVSLSMMFFTSGSSSASGVYSGLFWMQRRKKAQIQGRLSKNRKDEQSWGFLLLPLF
ncbi:hypothetical protein B0H10DRAFT_1394902 [Mycena sp. CBHHK59/15]|nr:hypothetical protein B0H10DRAFT_1394902 [Mycena sp. CBHHK59/15]